MSLKEAMLTQVLGQREKKGANHLVLYHTFFLGHQQEKANSDILNGYTFSTVNVYLQFLWLK